MYLRESRSGKRSLPIHLANTSFYFLAQPAGRGLPDSAKDDSRALLQALYYATWPDSPENDSRKEPQKLWQWGQEVLGRWSSILGSDWNCEARSHLWLIGPLKTLTNGEMTVIRVSGWGSVMLQLDAFTNNFNRGSLQNWYLKLSSHKFLIMALPPTFSTPKLHSSAKKK